MPNPLVSSLHRSRSAAFTEPCLNWLEEIFTSFFLYSAPFQAFGLSTPVHRQLQGVSCTISGFHDMVTGLRD